MFYGFLINSKNKNKLSYLNWIVKICIILHWVNTWFLFKKKYICLLQKQYRAIWLKPHNKLINKQIYNLCQINNYKIYIICHVAINIIYICVYTNIKMLYSEKYKWQINWQLYKIIRIKKNYIIIISC
jgi:hypothetical protein